ncbi:MAG: amino acid adenylation domain-containing protein, partial [Cyanobacteria bacterium P01_A01_bin.135]
LRQAWQQSVDQHDILRSGFYWEQRDEPFQVVHRQAQMPWVQQDWRSHSPELQQTRLQVFLDCNQTQPFDLQAPPLIRLALIQVGDRRYHLIWAYHHLILDGWSAANLIKSAFARYLEMASPSLGRSPSLPIAPQYIAYISWLQSQNRDAAKTFWQTYLQGYRDPTPLPILNPSAATPEPHRAEQQRSLSIQLTAQLRSFAQQHQLTLNTLIQGAFGLLLSRYSGASETAPNLASDVVFGVTSAGRPPELANAEAMVGLFINTLPVRVQVPVNAAVVPWLQQLQSDRAAASAYEYSALADVQGWSELSTGQPLFDCLLVVENYPVDAALLSGQSALMLEDVQFVEWTHFPLTLLVSLGKQVKLTAKYDGSRVSDEAIARLLVHIEILLMGLTRHNALSDLPLLTPAEQAQLQRWNQTEADYPSGCLTDLIEDQAARSPDAIALTFKDDALNYRELNARANRLAHQIQQRGVGPEVIVGVCLERSPEMVVALLAVLKAGGAYLPLDPSYPRDRLAYMLEDAAPTLLLFHGPTAALLAELPSPEGINLDALTPQQPDANPTRTTTPDNSIYVLYTSGSTGRPKGVANTHRALVNRLHWMQKAYALAEGDRVLQKTPLSFDVSGWELFWPLISGASLVLARPEGHKDSAYLVDLIQREQITVLHFVPAMLTAFLETPGVERCSSLKRVICSGEALPGYLQTQFFKVLPHVALHNLYGPTEAAIDVTAWTCRSEAAATVPIGRPISNTQIYLLDAQSRQVPPGIPGELHIGGVGLARGYLNRPDLTAERFIPNPFAALLDGHSRPVRAQGPAPLPVRQFSTNANGRSPLMYKTGDRARYRPDGAIEFLGRSDRQVKLRGFRIELGEIEAALVQHPQVSQAVVVLRDDPTLLVAYVVLEGDGGETNLAAFLAKTLPHYMVPSAILPLDALPLLPNGKLDRKTLPAPTLAAPQPSRSPQTPTETRIAAVWQDVLQLEQLGAEDNFFELGGHSLSAMRVNTRLRKAFGLELPLRAIFEAPTVAALAVKIDAIQMTTTQPASSAAGRKEIEL